MIRNFKTVFLSIVLPIIITLNGFSQRHVNEFGLKFLNPGFYYKLNVLNDFYIMYELYSGVSYAYEFSEEIEKSNFYLNPLLVKVEPRYKINEILYSCIQIKYGFPIKKTGDLTEILIIIGVRKSWGNIFLDIQTGTGVTYFNKKEDLAMIIDVGVGLELGR